MYVYVHQYNDVHGIVMTGVYGSKLHVAQFLFVIR